MLIGRNFYLLSSALSLILIGACQPKKRDAVTVTCPSNEVNVGGKCQPKKSDDSKLGEEPEGPPEVKKGAQKKVGSPEPDVLPPPMLPELKDGADHHVGLSLVFLGEKNKSVLVPKVRFLSADGDILQVKEFKYIYKKHSTTVTDLKLGSENDAKKLGINVKITYQHEGKTCELEKLITFDYYGKELYESSKCK